MSKPLSVDRRRTDVVRAIVVELFQSGRESIRTGDVNAVLRERDMPMGTWEVRAEFTNLEAEGVIRLDPAAAIWLPGDLDAATGRASG